MDDADGFSELYRSEGEDVLIFLTRRTFDGETAVELTAETFAIAMRSWRKLRGLAREQQRAWLFTVARRQLGHYLRRARVERHAVQRLGIQTPHVGHDDLLLIEQRAGLNELRTTLGHELARLSPDQQSALRLRIVEELPYPQVAEQLGISEQTARARVSRGLRALARALDHCTASQESSPLEARSATQGGSS